ncbi:DUF819 family protein [Salmonirosea aquatica]|uniref:DUF819 family protein n=1 Tax=Salmonirosea aquatica TaxID=2654236 RepID=A0A7C9F9Y5_9BACT|nr:DUF819 family protein [Cytophagaceae bacterium SJW1-29]
MPTHPLFVLAVLCLNVVICDWLATKPYFRHLGTALMVILLTAIVANLGIIPASSPPSPVYDGIFAYVAPISIFLLMLSVNLKSIRRAGPAMIGLFLVGAVGTVVGVAVAFKLLDAAALLGENYFALGGMLTGTYIGGSLNFNAVALHYGMAREGTLYAATTAADNIITALWIVATLALPALLRGKSKKTIAPAAGPNVETDTFDEQETINPMDVGLLTSLAFGAVSLADWVSSLYPVVPTILTITTVALVLAQFPVISRLRGSRTLGIFMIYLFLAVIGAYCDVPALLQDGTLAVWLLVMICIIVLVHAVLLIGVGKLLKQDADVIAIASQANIGGSSSALALARSLGRPDLQLPAILVGTLGNGLGTYLGFAVAEWLR